MKGVVLAPVLAVLLAAMMGASETVIGGVFVAVVAVEVVVLVGMFKQPPRQ